MNKMKRYIPALRYNWLTSIYDPFMKLFMKDESLKLTMLIQADIKPMDTILDFGCGTGTFIIMIKNIFFENAVYGVDIDPKVLKIAQDKVEEEGHFIKLIEYDGATLPFKEEMFDKVFSSLVFHHLTREQKEQALREIYRALKPGGDFILMDFGKPQNIFMRALFFLGQMFEGFETTRENVRGLMPALIRNAGFYTVTETRRIKSAFGSLSIYKAQKI